MGRPGRMPMRTRKAFLHWQAVPWLAGLLWDHRREAEYSKALDRCNTLGEGGPHQLENTVTSYQVYMNLCLHHQSLSPSTQRPSYRRCPHSETKTHTELA